jgi:hypothetical protein
MSVAQYRRAIATLAIILCTSATPHFAQTASTTDPGHDMQDGEMAHTMPHDMAHMSHGEENGLVPEIRESSGTSWQPDDSVMYAARRDVAGWNLMVHGNAFARVVHETGEPLYGATQVDSVNWFMIMAGRPAKRGRLQLRGMFSLEPWTVPGCGYPDHLATGEICKGDEIHDRQHPHNLFMEMAATYDRPLTPRLWWQLYGGPVGEPALGPTAFPHRMSAFPNPVAPISHHWLDSTHVSFGVVTTGIYTRLWKAEISVFNGREPDEHRASIEFGPLDSIAGRFTVAPTSQLVFQASTGYLRDAQQGVGTQPRESVTRFTSSMTYHRRPSESTFWATTIAYGTNSGTEIEPAGSFGRRTHALLVESSVEWRDRDMVFGRVEVTGKPAHDLGADEFSGAVFTVGKIQTGYARFFTARYGLVPGLGGSVSLALVPTQLTPRYDGAVAPGFVVFATVRPAKMSMEHK